MITREQMETYLGKGGYRTLFTGSKGIKMWQYKDTDMYCNTMEDHATYFDDQGLGEDRTIRYYEWSIDPGCGCLKKG